MQHSFDAETQFALNSIMIRSQNRGLVLNQPKSVGKKNENMGVLEILDALILKESKIPDCNSKLLNLLTFLR